MTDFQVPDVVIDAILDDGVRPIRAFREASGLSQFDVASQTGISEKRLAELETGRATATDEENDKVGAVLQVPSDLLVDE